MVCLDHSTFNIIWIWLKFRLIGRPLCNLYHHSPVGNISVLCTSHQKPYYRQPFLNSNIFYTFLPVTCNFNQNHMLKEEWFRHNINIDIFIFLHLPPWRWPREWPKRFGGHYLISLYHKTLFFCWSLIKIMYLIGDRGSAVIKVLCYKSEGRWFDPRWCRWNFSLT